MALDPAEVNKWILQIGQQKREPAEVAKEWITYNTDTVNRWLAGIDK